MAKDKPLEYMVRRYPNTYEAAVKAMLKSRNAEFRIKTADYEVRTATTYAEYQKRMLTYAIDKYWSKSIELMHFDSTPDDVQKLLKYLQIVKSATDARVSLIIKVNSLADVHHGLSVAILGAKERLKRNLTELNRLWEIGATVSHYNQLMATKKTDAVYAFDDSSYALTEMIKAAQVHEHAEIMVCKYTQSLDLATEFEALGR